LKEFLSKANFKYEESVLFTLLPSVTAISRSAIFQGNTDVYNLKSPGRATEAKAFATYFSDKETKYYTEQDSITDDNLLGYEYISILYNFFDDLSHSVQFPPNEDSKALYFEAVKLYLSRSAVLQTLQTLQSNDFAIYFCSDHGSVVAVGNGQRLEKYLVDSFAKRAVIVPIETKDHITHQKRKSEYRHHFRRQ